MPESTQAVIRCLQVPLQGSLVLLVPNAAVAEVVTYDGMTTTTGDAHTIGRVDWRGLSLPVLSFEALCGQRFHAPGQVGRLIVLHRLDADADLRYYAIAVEGIPHLTLVRPGMLQPVETADAERPVLQVVMAGNEQLLIPDLERIEKQIMAS